MTVSSRQRILMILVLVVVTFTVYSFMVNESFKTMDDEFCIVNNPDIRDIKNIGRLFTQGFFGGGSYYRPLVSTSFLVEYQLFGLNPFFYYVDNILIHLATAFLLFVLFRHFFRRDDLAFAASLLFAIHPVHWEAVSNIPGRAVLLSSFFSVATFLGFCLRGRNGLFFVVAKIAFVLALLSKEAAVVFPLVLFAYQGLVAYRKKSKWSPYFRPLIPFAVVEGLYFVLRHHLGMTKFFYWNDLPQAVLGFLTFLRSLITHIRVLVLPYDLHFDRSCRVFASFTDPGLLFTVVFWLAVIVVTVRFWQKIAPLNRFFVAWFFVEFLPVSQLGVSVGVQPGYISAAEHFLYMPAMAFVGLMILTGHQLYQINLRRQYISSLVAKVLIAAVFVSFALITVEQNIYSSNEIAMFDRTLTINPTNVRVRYNFGYVYAQKRLPGYAEREFRKVLDMTPEVVNARIALGKALCDQGKYWEGVQEYERIQDAGGLKDILDGNRHAAYRLLEDLYTARLKQNPDDYQVQYSLGVVYSKTGRFPEAMASYARAVELKPDFREAIFNLASTYEASGKTQKAATLYEQVVALPSTKDDYLNPIVFKHLAEIYQNLGEQAKAAAYNEKVQSPR